MHIFVLIMRYINKFLKIILVISVSITLISLFLQVISRFVFSFPLSWSEELSRYLTIWTILIGSGIAVRERRLIKLDVILMLVKEKYKSIFHILSAVISVIFYVIVIYSSLTIINVVHFQESPALNIPMSIPYLAIPIGFSIMLLNTFAVIFEDIINQSKSKKM